MDVLEPLLYRSRMFTILRVSTITCSLDALSASMLPCQLGGVGSLTHFTVSRKLRQNSSYESYTRWSVFKQVGI